MSEKAKDAAKRITDELAAAEIKLVASLPGSRNAVRLGMEKLLVPEVAHIVFELRKHQEKG